MPDVTKPLLELKFTYYQRFSVVFTAMSPNCQKDDYILSLRIYLPMLVTFKGQYGYGKIALKSIQ